MADIDTSTSRALLVKKPALVRGILWGLMFGLGLTVVLVVTTMITLELTQMIIVVAAGTLVGVLWSLFGPAKPPSGPVPVVLVNQRAKQPVTQPMVQHHDPLLIDEPSADATPTEVDPLGDTLPRPETGGPE